tara:strand:+ start:32685 stop:33977 length:1293 start_codon:yes stop_codon:yes gene_type:complete
MNIKSLLRISAVGAVALGVTFTSAPADAKEKLTMWSHFADHAAVRALFSELEATFEKENPNVDLDMTFYEKKSLFAAQMTALRAGAGPDIMYLEPDRVQFLDAGFVTPLNDLMDLDRLEDFAKEAWTRDGKVYALGMQAFTVENYYRKDLMDQIGVKLPDDFTQTQSEYLDMIKKASAAGITPIVQGIGDRPYPGSYLTHELLLRKLGRDDYAKLWAGTLSFKDKRVVEVFDFMKQVIDAGAYPKTFTTMKLGESHLYFHTKPGGLTFPLGSWYSSRAFNDSSKGGQPDGFPLGIMQFPKMDGGACPNCKTIGVAGSYAINANSDKAELAGKFLDVMAREEVGRKWISTVFVATGVKVDTSGGFKGKYADYFTQLGERAKGREFFLGTPIDHIRGKCKETFIQVMNAGFPAGLMEPSEAISMMEGACYKG